MNSKDISRSRNILTLDEKILILSHYQETKCSIRKLAKHFNIGKTQAGLIVKQEESLYEQWVAGNSGYTRKRLSNAGLEIDKKMHDWYLQKKKDNQDISGVALQNKALELAKDLGYDSFKASNGWLAKFVKRHGISFKDNKNQNQSKSKNKEKSNNLKNTLHEWSKSLSLIIDKYSKDDIFSAVQTGLFFKAAPDDVSHLLEKTCANGILSSERLTVLFCTNASGKKEKPLVIAHIPEKEIENLKLSELHCKSNSFAWLTKNIINEWLTDLNNSMIEQNKNIVLFLDHSIPCPDCQLSNIRVIYFPNVFSNKQRINQGIIQNFKVIYRFQMLKHLIALKENALDNSVSDTVIDLPQALSWISFSWKELSPNVIHKCFEEFLINITPDNICDEEAPLTLNDVSDLLCAYDSFVSPADYVGIDDCLMTEGEHPESVEILVDIDHMYTDNDEENVKESKNMLPNNVVDNFYYESLRSLKHLEQFYLSQNDSNGASLAKQLITHHENVINSKKKL